MGVVLVLLAATLPSTAASAASKPSAPTGTMIVASSGSPSAKKVVTAVSSGGYTTRTVGKVTLKGLKPGTYKVTAQPVYTTKGKWVPKPASITVKVVSGKTATARVSYVRGATTGTLQVTVSNTPAGKTANVVVTGPGRFKKALSKTTTLKNLKPGVYAVIAAEIPLSDGLTATPTASDATPVVLAGETSRVTVSYGTMVASNLIKAADTNLVAANVSDGRGSITVGDVAPYAVNDPVLLPATDSAPERIVLVESVKGSTVQVTPGSLYDALPVVDVEYRRAVPEKVDATSVAIPGATVSAQGLSDVTFFGRPLSLDADWSCDNPELSVDLLASGGIPGNPSPTRFRPLTASG